MSFFPDYAEKMLYRLVAQYSEHSTRFAIQEASVTMIAALPPPLTLHLDKMEKECTVHDYV